VPRELYTVVSGIVGEPADVQVVVDVAVVAPDRVVVKASVDLTRRCDIEQTGQHVVPGARDEDAEWLLQVWAELHADRVVASDCSPAIALPEPPPDRLLEACVYGRNEDLLSDDVWKRLAPS
jgi:hypothetical protein